MTTRATSARPRVREKERVKILSTRWRRQRVETAERTSRWEMGRRRCAWERRAGRASRALALESNEDDDVDGFEFHFATRVVNGDGSWTMAPRGAAINPARRDSAAYVAERVAFAADGTLTLEFDDGVDGWNDVACIVGRRSRLQAHAVEGRGDYGEAGGRARRGRRRVPSRDASRLEGGSVNLFSRFCMVDDVLDAALAIGPEGAALVLAWLRLSWLKQLHCTPEAITRAGHGEQARALAGRIAHAATTTTDPVSRGLMRASLAFYREAAVTATTPLGILNICVNTASERAIGRASGPVHRAVAPRLHSNTTPDDVKICEAYLHFLHTSNWGDFRAPVGSRSIDVATI